MNVFFSLAAQAAFNAASADIKSQANSLLSTYASYVNRHYLPGKSTLKTLRREARQLLGLPAGTPVFECGERRVKPTTNHPTRAQIAAGPEPTTAYYASATNLQALCNLLNACPPPAGFDFCRLPTFGSRPDWLWDESLVASWSDDAVIALPEHGADKFRIVRDEG